MYSFKKYSSFLKYDHVHGNLKKKQIKKYLKILYSRREKNVVEHH